MFNQNSIGVVSKVFPNKIVIEIPDTTKIDHNFMGDLYMCEGINTFITIYKSRFEMFIYQIVSLYEQEKPFINDEEVSKFSGKAYFEATPMGEIHNEKFEFGLSKFPMIGNDVFMTINEDIETILQLDNEDISIPLGTMTTHNNYLPKFSIDNLLSHHMSILGNTGSGKSTTARKLLHEIVHLSERNEIDIEKVNFVIFDVHDEYESLPERFVNKVMMENIAIPLETLAIEDWINLVQPSSAVQSPILMQGLRMANLLEKGEVKNSWIKAYCVLELYNNVQTEVVGKRAKIISMLNKIEIEGMEEILIEFNTYGSFNKTKVVNYEIQFKETLERFIETESTYSYIECGVKIAELMELSDCTVGSLGNLVAGMEIVFLFEEMKGNAQVRSYCSTLMTRIDNLVSIYSKSLFDDSHEKREKFQNALDSKKGFTIFKCSNMDDSDLLFFTGYILRLIYTKQKEVRQASNAPAELFHFVFDEAHKYISENNNDNNIRSLKVFEQIAKEGRKFGLFMILVSQRPSELSKTVLSQCNNFILHRIRNNIDIEQMRKSIPYISDSQLLRIAYLKTGSALLVGEAFSIPMELIIDGAEYGEHSKTVKPSDVWKIEEK
ncbi:ATP-binding protein [Sporosarcina sp. FSL K6-3508]|uniref:ATP-binding protein n=1 Tax=Sporosarcina sp. FSL K6-3508 TaxID=2921557 RepID=UPI00315B23CD